MFTVCSLRLSDFFLSIWYKNCQVFIFYLLFLPKKLPEGKDASLSPLLDA